MGTPREYGIGELAQAAGVSVKTVRFYSDSGLLPEAGRTAGGHRRYAPEAVERLRTVRRLRALGLGLPAVAGVLRGEAGVAAAVAAERREVERRLAELRWREAALAALAEFPEALEVVGDALGGAPSTDVFARFWRRVLPLRLPPSLVAAIVDAAVPDLPAEPTPDQVLAYARLHALTADRAVAAAIREADGGAVCAGDARRLYEGLGEAYDLARSGRADALDAFVAAHAAPVGAADTPAFRRALAGRLSVADPRMTAYWTLAGRLDGGRPGMGDTHARLTEQLVAAVAARAA